jgi:peptidoglycan/LPS O-acetylase OafA/YrhL
MGIIRILLAISVIISHSNAIFGFNLVGGRIAVQSFYIISGFYMALILSEKYIDKNYSYKLFITNRFLRLYPIYWIILFLTILYSVMLYLHSGSSIINLFVEHYNSMSFISFFFLICTNLFMFFQDMVMFLGLDATGNLFFTENFHDISPALHNFLFIPQAWTIGIELMFYLIAPFIIKRKSIYIIGYISCSLLIRLVLVFCFNLNYDPWTYRFFPTEIMFFMIGILAYRIYRYLPCLFTKHVRVKKLEYVCMAFTIVFSFLPETAMLKNNFVIKDCVYLLIFFMCIPFIFTLTKNWKIDRYIGELSYPIYISHTLVLSCIHALKISTIGNVGLYLVILTILFSIVLNEFVSKRIEKIRQKRIK